MLLHFNPPPPLKRDAVSLVLHLLGRRTVQYFWLHSVRAAASFAFNTFTHSNVHLVAKDRRHAWRYCEDPGHCGKCAPLAGLALGALSAGSFALAHIPAAVPRNSNNKWLDLTAKAKSRNCGMRSFLPICGPLGAYQTRVFVLWNATGVSWLVLERQEALDRSSRRVSPSRHSMVSLWYLGRSKVAMFQIAHNYNM